MTIDPQLLLLASQLGNLLKAYGGASLENGHAMMEVIAAIQYGMNEELEEKQIITLDLPMRNRGLRGQPKGAHDTNPYDIAGTFGVRLEIHPTVIDIEGTEYDAETKTRFSFADWATLQFSYGGTLDLTVYERGLQRARHGFQRSSETL